MERLAWMDSRLRSSRPALTSMAHARAREGRGGADSRALGSLRLAPAAAAALGREATGPALIPPRSQLDGTIGVDVNSDPSRARGPGRRRQPRSGIAAAGAGVFFFDLAAGVRALAAAAPLRRRRLLRPRWVARYGVGFDSTPIATGRHFGVDVNSDPSRARGPGRRRQPRSGIAAAGAGVFFFDLAGGWGSGVGSCRPAAAAPAAAAALGREYGVGFDSTPIATGRHYRR